MFRWNLMLQNRFGLRGQQSQTRRAKRTVKPQLEELTPRILPSASPLPVVSVASPPPVPSISAITTYVTSMMEQEAQLIATIQQDLSTALNALGQEVSFAEQQWDRILGINPAASTPAPNNTVSPPSSSNGMSQGHASGSGSGSSATPDQPITSGQGNTKGQPVTSGSGSGIAMPEASGGGTATIKGQVWLDNNGNSYEDNGELGFSGITVWLCGPTGNQIQSEVTDSNGDYSFGNLSAGGQPPTNQYCIQVIIPTNDTATYVTANSVINTAGFSPVYTLTPGLVQVVNAGLLSMTVTTVQDDGTVPPIQDQITLRDAIQTGNNGGGPLGLHTISFNSDADSGTISLQKALPAINRSYNIVGPGSSSPTVEGGGAANPFPIFTVNDGVTSTISGLKITGGYVSGQNGGGIVNSGTLTLSNDYVSKNTAAANADNKGGAGGGIFNASDGNLTLSGTEVVNNTAASAGGGVANTGTLTTTAGIASQIADNNAQVGGGIANVGGGTSAKIGRATTIAGNVATEGGGGVFNSLGDVTISGSSDTGEEINHNRAPSGGGIYVVSGTLTLNSWVNIDTNSATAGDGGGMYLAAASTTNFNNVIVSGNTATAQGGVGGQGPGVAYVQGADLNNWTTGLTDDDDPGKAPVQV